MRLSVLILILFTVSPAVAQGLTVNMIQTDADGKKSYQVLQTDATRAKLALANGSKLLYNSATKKLNVMFAGTEVYTELTPQLIQIMTASLGRGQPTPVPINYKRTGSSKVGQWECSTYDGFRGAEKVAELCAAEGPAVGLAPADFNIVQQAVDSVRKLISQDVLDSIPNFGAGGAQGFNGFPVRRVVFVNGKPDTTVDFVDIRRGTIPDSTFAVPTAVPAAPAGRAK